MIGIYKITNPKGFVYIGKSLDITKRMKIYAGNKCKKQYLLHNSLQEFGFFNHKVDILEECNKDELHELERKYILKFKKKSLNIVNAGHDKIHLLNEWNISAGRSKIIIRDYSNDSEIPLLNP